MLITTHNPEFFDSYENDLKNQIHRLTVPFENVGSLNVDELSILLNNADEHSRKIHRYTAWIENRDSYFKPVDTSSIPSQNKFDGMRRSLNHGGYYEMDNSFVQEMLNAGKFRTPKPDERYTLCGAGSSLQEIHRHMLHCLIFSSDLLNMNAVVNVVESDDWELLALLGHIDSSFGLKAYKKHSVPSFRPKSKYPGDFLGQERLGLLGTLMPNYYSDQIINSAEDLMRIRNRVESYRQKHDSFFFFEALLVHQNFVLDSPDNWKSWARDLLIK